MAPSISDPCRIIQLDELPQFIDYHTQRTKAAGRVGVPLQKSSPENRECVTVNAIGDLGGFINGMRTGVASKNFVGSMADCLQAPEWAKKFDDEIYLLDGKSTCSLISKTDKGMQTGKSFLEMLMQWLRKQIDHRNRLEECSCCHAFLACTI